MQPWPWHVVTATGSDHHANFDISPLYSVPENCNVQFLMCQRDGTILPQLQKSNIKKDRKRKGEKCLSRTINLFQTNSSRYDTDTETDTYMDTHTHATDLCYVFGQIVDIRSVQSWAILPHEYWKLMGKRLQIKNKWKNKQKCMHTSKYNSPLEFPQSGQALNTNAVACRCTTQNIQWNLRWKTSLVTDPKTDTSKNTKATLNCYYVLDA